MKRFLIYTVTAGNGHNSSAKAVKECLERQGAEVKLVDLLQAHCKNKTYVWTQAGGYALAVALVPGIFNAFFRFFQKRDPKKYNKAPVQAGLKGFYDALLKEIYDFRPDAIYCSHFLPSIMITNLRKIYKIPCVVYSFVTDYIVCPFLEAAYGIDKMLIPNESFIPLMLAKNFSREQLLPYGLPVREEFSEHMEKHDARQKLGLKDGVFTIMVMYGGGFWSGSYKIVKNIVKHCKARSLQIIVANGINKKDKMRIDKLKTPKNITMLNYGFSNQVEVLMSASDLLLGKAGGVSVTEALNKYLPMVCCSRLPEQEKANVRMLLKEGAGKQFKHKRELINILKDLINNPQKLLEMRENVARIRRPDATKLLARDMLACSATYDFDTSAIDYSKVNYEIKKMLRSREA